MGASGGPAWPADRHPARIALRRAAPASPDGTPALTALPAPAAHPAPATQSILRGIFFMCLAATVLPVMNAFVKYLAIDYHPMAIVWARTTGHFVFMLALFAATVGPVVFRTARPGLQVARSALHLGSMLCFFTAIAYVPLAEASAIGFIAPFLVTALSGPLLGEKVGIRRWTAVVVGFSGALVVARPGSGTVPVEGLLLFGSALCHALYQILTRRVAPFDRPETSALYSGMVGSLLMSMVVPFVWLWPTATVDAAVFLSLGVLGGLGHYFLARAFMWGPASVIAPFNYGQIIVATTLGWAIFGHLPDVWTWVGVAIIIASGLYIAWRETRRRALRNRLAPDETR
ncbi:MAG: DMT family transporter [Alphaproteobacteria bacterium]